MKRNCVKIEKILDKKINQGNNYNKKDGDFWLRPPSSQPEFKEQLTKVVQENRELKYRDCHFSFLVDISNYVFNKKVRFHNCTFEKGIKCRNTTFSQLVDFYQSTFKENQIFHLTDFLDISIFSEAIFEKAVIFRHNKVSKNTYISFEKATFKNGLDISNSNFWCTLQVYGVKIINNIPDLDSLSYYAEKNNSTVNHILKSNNYNSNLLDNIKTNKLQKYLYNMFKCYLPFNSNLDPSKYLFDIYIKKSINTNFQKLDDKILLLELFKSTFKGLRESYRRIKQEFRKNENHIEALDFQHHEMTVFKKELKYTTVRNYEISSNHDKHKNQIILFLNKISNDYNRSWVKGFVFTLLTGVFFYSTSSIFYLFDRQIVFDLYCFVETLNDFISYLNPLSWNHKPYNIENTSIIIWLYFGKIMIGYGYYQTIQAFRKYGKN